MLLGAYTTKEYRCEVEALPPGFPGDLAETLTSCRKVAGTAAHQQRVDKAVSEYLRPIRGRERQGASSHSR